MTSALLTKLALRGCAVEEMLSDTFMGREDFYEKMLRQFPKSTAFDRLEKSVAAGEVAACFEAAHELKGLYGTLGLTPAYMVCCRIVEIVRPLSGMEGVADLLTELRLLHREFTALVSAT